MHLIDPTCLVECFLFHVIIGKHFLFKFIVTRGVSTIAMLLRPLRQVFWKKSAFYIRHLHNNITILLIPKVQNKTSLKKIYLIRSSFTLSVCECLTFFFINGIFKTLIAQKLPRCIFFFKNFLQMFLYSNAYDAYTFLEISENENKEYLHLLYKQYRANVIKFMKVSSNLTQCDKRRNTND